MQKSSMSKRSAVDWQFVQFYAMSIYQQGTNPFVTLPKLLL